MATTGSLKPTPTSPAHGPTGQPGPPVVDESRTAKPTQPTGAAAHDVAGEETPIAWNFLVFTAAPSWMISLIVHMVVLFSLALVTIQPTSRDPGQVTVNAPEPMPDEVEHFELSDIVEVSEMQLAPSSLGSTDSALTQAMAVEIPDMEFSGDLGAAPLHTDLTDFAERTAPKNLLTKMIGVAGGTGSSGSGSGSGLGGRGRMTGNALMAQGGTDGSEKAVAAALKWFAAHQLPDGGWCFDHTLGPGARLSPNPGQMHKARNGATAMALLPFLGAGQTHKEGEFKEVVARGLEYLVLHQKPNGSFHEEGGRMYSHGLCSIVLCEAYAMTQDKKLAASAQASLNFIVYAQDPVGGGWRYDPRAGGDTSVVGWQLMALKSGTMGYLQVPSFSGIGASRFLDAVQSEGGAKYGYAEPGAGQATTAVGLLCRMYLGWKQDNDALKRGVEYLSQTGPSPDNMYYNYYATQVMRHYGGEPWTKWNDLMRESLIASQSKEGPTRGSWFIAGDIGSEHGGRIYCTSMSTMVLEVYYRHLPIYGQKAADEDFPL